MSDGEILAVHGVRTIYRSKRDSWIVLVLLAGAAAMVLAAFDVWSSPGPLGFRLTFLVSMLAVAALVLWILAATDYVLHDGWLTVHCGPFRQSVRLDTVIGGEPSRNPLSAPALSLDRLHLHCSDRRFGVLISPRDRETFLRDLASRCAGLRVEGDRLVSDELPR